MKAKSLYPVYVTVIACGVALFALFAPQSTSGQAAAPAAEMSPQFISLTAEVTKQNTDIAANQVQIDAKIDQIAEYVRQARIYAARGGRGGAR
jgi:hypothetical protein